MTVYLLDNSVLQRLDRAPAVTASVATLIGGGDLLGTSDITRLKAGFSATNSAVHDRVMDGFANDLYLLPLDDQAGDVAVDLQRAMFEAGRGRAAGTADLLQAAIAIVHDAVIVHYDADFELLAEVEPRLRHQWVLPRGSVD